MKIQLLLLLYFLIMLISNFAIACDKNSRANFEKRARDFFEEWDVNKNSALEIEEFLMSSGFYNLNSLQQQRTREDFTKISVKFMKEKLNSIPAFNSADADKSKGLSFKEWLKTQPPSLFIEKCDEFDIPAHEDISRFIEKRDLCDHFRGEEPYTPERKALLNKQIKVSCKETDKDFKNLKTKYKKNPELIKLFEQYEEIIEE